MEVMLKVTMRQPMMKTTKTVRMRRTMVELEASLTTLPSPAVSSLQGGEAAVEPA